VADVIITVTLKLVGFGVGRGVVEPVPVVVVLVFPEVPLITCVTATKTEQFDGARPFHVM
jgi:hypothetical protein